MASITPCSKTRASNATAALPRPSSRLSSPPHLASIQASVLRVVGSLTILFLFLPAGIAQTTYSGGEADQGVPFPLPQKTNSHGRRIGVGFSNSLGISWDGKLLIYLDRVFSSSPTQEVYGFVFTAFDPSKVVVDGNGQPDFGACFGTPLPRFAALKFKDPALAPNGGNDYPEVGKGYPDLPGTMGELGLLDGREFLTTNFYPVPSDDLPADAYLANPYPSDADGVPASAGSYRTYRTYVSFQDKPRFWNSSQNEWKSPGTYEEGLYPNGYHLVNNNPSIGMKRNGLAKLEIVVDLTTSPQTIEKVEVLEKWTPFHVHQSGWSAGGSGLTRGESIPDTTNDDHMWADNFEPSLTFDGHLMVGKGSEQLVRPFSVDGKGGSRVVFYYNEVPFGLGENSPWQGPWHLHKLYLKRDVDIDPGPDTVTLGELYPLARHPIKDYDGTIFGDADGDGVLADLTEASSLPFEGGYQWISPDGRYLLFSVKSGGVGDDHPELLVNPDFSDGGGGSNRAQVSVVGSVTNWQIWRIDHPAFNPSRHYFTAWDQDSRTVYQRPASFGFGPGFWEMLRGTPGVPMRRDDRTKLQLINSMRLLYTEVDLGPAMERDFGFYLPMSLMLDLNTNYASKHDYRRKIDLSRTPDFSGNGHFAAVDSQTGGKLPCEYFELPSAINTDPTVPGLYEPAGSINAIHPQWGPSDVISDGSGYWALLADGEGGKDDGSGGGIAGDGDPDSQPFLGRGEKHDMDSDVCWGRVGQAMFFEEGTEILIENTDHDPNSPSAPPELNPGSTIADASEEFSAMLWVFPLQARTGSVDLMKHHFRIRLLANGKVRVGVEDAAGQLNWLLSGAGATQIDTWTHIVMTWNVDSPQGGGGGSTLNPGSKLRLYIDGVEAPASPKSFSFDELKTYGLTDDIVIGCPANVATDSTQAVLLLDEVALRNSAMTPEEVANAALLPIPQGSWDDSGLPDEPLPFVDADHARVPTTNPYRPEVAELGADLFRDVQLSANQQISCATCHVPELAFTDGLSKAIGLTGVLRRNTSTIYNQRYNTRQFWDARAVDLEDQALDPVLNADEMGLNWAQVKQYLDTDVDYRTRFDTLFGTNFSVTEEVVRQALATYMRAPTAGDSRADRFAASGLPSLLTTSELRGRGLFFGKARCSGCHHGPNFTDGLLWSTGTFLRKTDPDFDAGAADPGAAFGTAGRSRFLGAFKTPTLRELTRTGPYFHDGHASTIEDVIDFYDGGGVRTGGYGLLETEHDVVAEEINRPLRLTLSEKADLAAYLRALTGDTIDDGPTGLNAPPTVVGAFSPTSVTLAITDPDGADDLDTSMVWTLDVKVTGPPTTFLDWSNVTPVSIPGGWQVTFSIPNGASVQAKAADHHGLWSAEISN